jgi:hypothetical protein
MEYSAGCTVMPPPSAKLFRQLAAWHCKVTSPPASNASRQLFQPNPASQRQVEIVVSQKPDSEAVAIYPIRTRGKTSLRQREEISTARTMDKPSE